MQTTKYSNSKTIFASSVFLLSTVMGCANMGSTKLFAEFNSYQSPDAVRAVLAKTDKREPWTEDSKSFSPVPPDKRPAYHFIYMSGPYESMGISGRLKLTFYNDRLMEAQFSTSSGRVYLNALSGHSTMPQRSAEEIVVDHRTRFRFDIDSNGDYRFTWYDPKLESEWLKWASAYA